MAVPTQRQVSRRQRLQAKFGNEEVKKEEIKPITQEEHNARIEKLKALGLIK